MELRITSILREKYSGRDVDLIEKWAANPLLLDEVLRPKEACCLGYRHNLELASDGFPAKEVEELHLSYAAAVESIRPQPCGASGRARSSET